MAVNRGGSTAARDRARAAAKRAAESYDRFVQGSTDEVYAPWEKPELAEALERLEALGTGGGAQTGFGRRILGREGRDWTPTVPYPQVEPSPTSNEQRPRTVAYGYDPFNQIVRVTFREGAIYEYYGVPPRIYENFANTDSPGVFINTTLNGFAYQRRHDLETIH